MRRESLLDEDDFRAMAIKLRAEMNKFSAAWKGLPFEIRFKNADGYRRISAVVNDAAIALEQAHRIANLYDACFPDDEKENRPEGRQG